MRFDKCHYLQVEIASEDIGATDSFHNYSHYTDRPFPSSTWTEMRKNAEYVRRDIVFSCPVRNCPNQGIPAQVEGTTGYKEDVFSRATSEANAKTRIIGDDLVRKNCPIRTGKIIPLTVINIQS